MKRLASDVTNRVKVLLCIVGIFWILQVINLLSGYQLNNLGIVPRDYVGLRGILFAPFLHGSIHHLLMNTVPFVVLGFLVILRGVSFFFQLTFAIVVLGGLGVWCFGQAYSLHVGASGLVFGYFGFLVFKGVVDKSISTLFVSCVVFLLYGGMIWGVFPGRVGVSWESHLFGCIAGVLCTSLSHFRKASS